MVTVRVASSLRPLLNGVAKTEVKAENVIEALLVAKLGPHVIEDLSARELKLKPGLNVFVNDDDVRFMDQELLSPLVDGDEVNIMQAVAGG